MIEALVTKTIAVINVTAGSASCNRMDPNQSENQISLRVEFRTHGSKGTTDVSQS